MKGRERLLVKLGHSFPLKDLMDSLRYKNRPAVHYVILQLYRPMCTAPLYKYIS